MTPQQVAGGFWLPGAVRLSGGIEEHFRQRIEALPTQTRRLLLIAAAEPVGDPDLLWRTAAQMEIDAAAAAPAVEANLVDVGSRVQFRHPRCPLVVDLVCATAERREVHAALGDATDLQRDPDRRAWHRAMPHPDPTRRSPRSWSGRRGARVPEAAWQLRPHSSSARRCSAWGSPRRTERAGGRIGDDQGRWVRRCPRSAGPRGVGVT